MARISQPESVARLRVDGRGDITFIGAEHIVRVLPFVGRSASTT